MVPPATTSTRAPGRSGEGGQGLLTAKSPWPTRWRTPSSPAPRSRVRPDGPDGLTVAERSLPAARAGDRPRWPDGQDHQYRARAGTSTGRGGARPRPRHRRHPRSRIPTGSAGCPAAPGARSTPPLLRVPDLRGFLRRHHRPVVQPRLGLVHFYLDRFIPDDTVANGGIFAWHDGRENPDTLQCLSPSGKRRSTATAPTTATARATTPDPRHRGTLHSPGARGAPDGTSSRSRGAPGART